MKRNEGGEAAAVECGNCGELRTDVRARQNDEVMCDACWESALDHGFKHVPEAFTCEVCGEERRSAVADASGRVICAACRPVVAYFAAVRAAAKAGNN